MEGSNRQTTHDATSGYHNLARPKLDVTPELRSNRRKLARAMSVPMNPPGCAERLPRTAPAGVTPCQRSQATKSYERKSWARSITTHMRPEEHVLPGLQHRLPGSTHRRGALQKSLFTMMRTQTLPSCISQRHTQPSKRPTRQQTC